MTTTTTTLSLDFNPPAHATALLLFADGLILYGRGHGAYGSAFGEICFNTAMTGYQEVITDPSYYKQIVTFTFPHIGNVGANAEDMESAHAYASGMILRESITSPANYRSELPLTAWLVKQGVVAISGIDTRAVTQYVRKKGAQNVLIYYPENGLQGTNIAELHRLLLAQPAMDGLELASEVSCNTPFAWDKPLHMLDGGPAQSEAAEPADRPHIVVVDYGVKYAILRCLRSAGARITVVPATSTFADVMQYKPDGVCLSNGPGDPARTYVYTQPLLHALLEAHVPVLGICLGYQLLALALGAQTGKMPQGHRGANHPVQVHAHKRVEITSQNHGFGVLEETVPAGVAITRASLFDGSLEGLASEEQLFLAVQYHPESSPGPHDSRYIFGEFMQMIATASLHAEEKRVHA